MHPFNIFADMVDHHLWNKKALTSIESHSLIGRPGQDRFCNRCATTLDAGWRNTNLPVPPTCEEVLAERYKAARTVHPSKELVPEMNEKSSKAG